MILLGFLGYSIVLRNEKKSMNNIKSKITVFVIFIMCTCSLLSNDNTLRKNAIIVGATSGMGRATAKLLAEDGYTVGLVGRREGLLKSLQQEIKNKSFIKCLDVVQVANAKEKMEELIEEMGGIDLILISISAWEPGDRTWESDYQQILVDALGVWVMSEVALKYFKKQNSGHLVAISSISGIRGSAGCPAYCGAKAFVQRYLEGTRNYMLQNNIPIHVTDIIPGWVDIERMKFSEVEGTYWVIPAEQAAHDIFDAIKKKKI